MFTKKPSADHPWWNNPTHRKIQKTRVRVTTINGDVHTFEGIGPVWELTHHPNYITIPIKDYPGDRTLLLPHRLIERIEYETFDVFEEVK